MNTILTDDELKAECRVGFGIDPVLDGNLIAYARAVEAAVLAKLAQQEPVAWHTEDHLTDRSATTYSKEAMQRWKGKGWPVTPLYTRPAPQQADRQRVPEGWRETLMAAQKALHRATLPMTNSADMQKIHAALHQANELLAAALEAPQTEQAAVQACSDERPCIPCYTDNGLCADLAAAPEAPAQTKPCLVKGDCKHGAWCSENYCQEHCQFVKSAQASAVDERAAFEAWWNENGLGPLDFQWEAWQARAALAHKGD